jgi:hypothetical protein
MASTMAHAPPSQIDSRKLSESLILTQMIGRIDEAVALRHVARFAAVLNTITSQEPTWIIDGLAISGFDAAAVRHGAGWFQEFKRRGGRRIAFVSKFGPARMAARAVSFGAGLQTTNFESLAEAYHHFDVTPGAAGP